MQIINCEQRSDEWYTARCGVPTASNFAKIVTTTGAPSKQREPYLLKLAGELVTGRAEETYCNAAMQHGIDTEDDARSTYELITGTDVEQVGFCIRDGAGASPDGLAGEGLLEIKCPQVHTHAKYLLNNKLPSEYLQQVQGQMYVTGRPWCDFFSYYPDMKPLLIRVERDENFISKLSSELKAFCEELQDVVNVIKG